MSNLYYITETSIRRNSLRHTIEEYSKKLCSTFELIFDELKFQTGKAVFTEDLRGTGCGTVETYNFKLTKKELSKDNHEYTFEHGEHKIILKDKFPLSGEIYTGEEKCTMITLDKEEELIEYINLVKKYLDYFILDRDKTDIYKNGKIISDIISEQDYKNREQQMGLFANN